MPRQVLNPVTVLPGDLKPGDALGFKVIAVIHDDRTWSAYRGLTDWSDDRVINEGDVIHEQAAKELFYAPNAVGLRYHT